MVQCNVSIAALIIHLHGPCPDDRPLTAQYTPAAPIPWPFSFSIIKSPQPAATSLTACRVEHKRLVSSRLVRQRPGTSSSFLQKSCQMPLRCILPRTPQPLSSRFAGIRHKSELIGHAVLLRRPNPPIRGSFATSLHRCQRRHGRSSSSSSSISTAPSNRQRPVNLPRTSS